MFCNVRELTVGINTQTWSGCWSWPFHISPCIYIFAMTSLGEDSMSLPVAFGLVTWVVLPRDLWAEVRVFRVQLWLQGLFPFPSLCLCHQVEQNIPYLTSLRRMTQVTELSWTNHWSPERSRTTQPSQIWSHWFYIETFPSSFTWYLRPRYGFILWNFGICSLSFPLLNSSPPSYVFLPIVLSAVILS